MNTSLGFIPSPPDSRDFNLGLIQPPHEIPKSYLTDISALVIRHQNGQPSCVSEATGSMIELFNLWDTKLYQVLSRRFIYSLAKAHDGLLNNEGTYYRQGLKEASQYGICLESLFTSDVSLSKDKYKDSLLIPEIAYDDAQLRIIKSYARVTDTSFQGLKQAIFDNKVVLLGLRYAHTWTQDKDGERSYDEVDILPLRPGEWISGHAVLAYGYDENYIYFLNSFGDTWGRKGSGYFDRNYLKEGGFVEGWVAVDLPNEMVISLKKKLTILQKLVDMYKKLIWLIKIKRSQV